jgi:hypothetical protein
MTRRIDPGVDNTSPGADTRTVEDAHSSTIPTFPLPRERAPCIVGQSECEAIGGYTGNTAQVG